LADASHPRRGARDLLVLALYQQQLSGHDMAELVEQFESRDEFATIDQVYFHDLLRRVLETVETLDAVIAELAVRSLQQLDAVGLAILRLAVAELKYRIDVPSKVIINEAVELAKRYGAADSYRFVNAVLDKAAKQVEARKASA
jgi:N utilization substance protein B